MTRGRDVYGPSLKRSDDRGPAGGTGFRVPQEEPRPGMPNGAVACQWP